MSVESTIKNLVSIDNKNNKLSIGDVLMPLVLKFNNKNNSISIGKWINKPNI